MIIVKTILKVKPPEHEKNKLFAVYRHGCIFHKIVNPHEVFSFKLQVSSGRGVARGQDEECVPAYFRRCGKVYTNNIYNTRVKNI